MEKKLKIVKFRENTLLLSNKKEAKVGDLVYNEGDYDEPILFTANEGLFDIGLDVNKVIASVLPLGDRIPLFDLPKSQAEIWAEKEYELQYKSSENSNDLRDFYDYNVLTTGFVTGFEKALELYNISCKPSFAIVDYKLSKIYVDDQDAYGYDIWELNKNNEGKVDIKQFIF